MEILLYGLNLHQNQELIEGINKRIEDELKFPPENSITFEKLLEIYYAMGYGSNEATSGLEVRV